MKLKLSALIVVLASMSFSAVADATASFSVSPAESQHVFNIKYKSLETGTVKISVYDSGNTLLFTEVLTNVSSFVRPYNFSELKEGEYTIVVSDKSGEQIQKVNYSTNKISSYIKVTELANTESKYVVNITNNGSEDVRVKIFMNDDTLLHDQIERVSGSFGLVYNLSKIKTATSITFEITTNSGKVERITF